MYVCVCTLTLIMLVHKVSVTIIVLLVNHLVYVLLIVEWLQTQQRTWSYHENIVTSIMIWWCSFATKKYTTRVCRYNIATCSYCGPNSKYTTTLPLWNTIDRLPKERIHSEQFKNNFHSFIHKIYSKYISHNNIPI